MKIKKLIAGIAAAAAAVSMMAVNAFAATYEMDSEYPGPWLAGTTIPKEELTAVGGDVKLVFNIQIEDRFGIEKQYVFSPQYVDENWQYVRLADYMTSDTAIAKTDGMFCVTADTTSVEMVLSKEALDLIPDENGLFYTGSGMYITSVDISAGTPQGEIPRVDDATGIAYSKGEITYAEATGGAPAAEEAPAEAAPADAAPAETTTAPATGNVPAAVMLSVMAAAGVAAVATKKRK